MEHFEKTLRAMEPGQIIAYMSVDGEIYQIEKVTKESLA